MGISRTNEIKISENDAVVILRADGTVEASLPEMAGGQVAENMIMGAALVNALADEGLYELIRDRFFAEVESQENAA
ncbi:MAG: hypothetical protein ACK5O7_07100 [Holosporales bacterium]